MNRNSLCSLALACTLALPGSAAAENTADQEIQYLLEFVSNSGCTFMRNGDDHHSPDAADHLRPETAAPHPEIVSSAKSGTGGCPR